MVWIVDDDPDDQLLIDIAFKRLVPAIVTRAIHDGEELLTCLKQVKELPKLVLLDLNMPRKDGFATLSELRANAAYKDLPVVILTTSTDLEDQQKAALAGANEFLVKPPTSKGAVRMLEELVAKWNLH